MSEHHVVVVVSTFQAKTMRRHSFCCLLPLPPLSVTSVLFDFECIPCCFYIFSCVLFELHHSVFLCLILFFS